MNRGELGETRAVVAASFVRCLAAQLIGGLTASARLFETEGSIAGARNMAAGIFLVLGGLKMAPTPDGITRRELLEAGKQELGEHLAACPLHPELAEAWFSL